MALSISRQNMTEIPKHKHHILIRKISYEDSPENRFERFHHLDAIISFRLINSAASHKSK